MPFYNKTWVRVLAVIVVLLAAGLAVWKLTAKRESGIPQVVNTTIENDNSEAATDLSQSEALQGNIMEGTLKASDNPKRGNLMLVTASSTIYIYTSRDFTALLDKEVKVSYDGTTDNFRLGDIIAK